MNNDCNNTAGLEAVLKLAVGARVMLRRNIDVKVGLVNGALGTVTAITSSCVCVKFDHLDEPCDIQRVKGKFTVLKNYYIYRTQFPLMLAYAVTIHKCQGLSLNAAIIDLSDKVFADGMAYVALSRVCSISGLHIVHFDPNSIRVSTSSLREINRLRKQFRKDLPLYAIPKKRPTKRTLTGDCDAGDDSKPPAKIPKKQPKSSGEVVISGTGTSGMRVCPFSYHPVDSEWQHNVCQALGIPFVKDNQVASGAADVPLTSPHENIAIVGDGNCMFRSLISGSQDHHQIVRAKIVQHMKDIPSDSAMGRRIVQHMKGYDANYVSIADYLNKTGMEKPGVWGSDIELLVFAHLVSTNVFSYNVPNKIWERYGPDVVDTTQPSYAAARALYLTHTHDHFMVVHSTEGLPNASDRQKDNGSNDKKADGCTKGKGCVPPSDDHKVTGIWEKFRFHYVDQQWQQTKCQQLSLPFHRHHSAAKGGPNVLLTCSDPKGIRAIRGDGNCLFRCFSYLLTGDQRHFSAVRMAVIAHMYDIPQVVVGDTSKITSVAQYLKETGMDKNRTWGTDREVYIMASLLQTMIYLFQEHDGWIQYSPSLGHTTLEHYSAPAMYIRLQGQHFEVVLRTLPKDTPTSPSILPKDTLTHPAQTREKSGCDHQDKPPEKPIPTRVWEMFRFHYVDQKWQQDKSALLSLPFKCYHGAAKGGPYVLLTRPDPKGIRAIRGDGNCLFRCFSYLLTGDQRHFSAVHRAVIAHMYDIPQVVVGDTSKITSVAQYLKETGMDKNRTWGTDREVYTMASLLQTMIYLFQEHDGWVQYSPSLGHTTLEHYSAPAMYIRLQGQHFEVVSKCVV